jgi:hypothetical protein
VPWYLWPLLLLLLPLVVVLLVLVPPPRGMLGRGGAEGRPPDDDNDSSRGWGADRPSCARYWSRPTCQGRGRERGGRVCVCVDKWYFVCVCTQLTIQERGVWDALRDGPQIQEGCGRKPQG